MSGPDPSPRPRKEKDGLKIIMHGFQMRETVEKEKKKKDSVGRF